MSSGYRGDFTGRVLGVITFLVGVGLLCLVFYLAYELFRATPAQALGLTFSGDPKRDPSAMNVGSQFAWLLGKIALMFIMAIAGSLVSQKGINFYFSAMKGTAVDVVARATALPPTG